MAGPYAGAHKESRFAPTIQPKSSRDVALRFRKNDLSAQAKSMAYAMCARSNCRRWVSGVSAGLGCQAEGQRFAVGSIGRHAVKARVWASSIVKAEVASDGGAGVAGAGGGPQGNPLRL